ncbi:MAG: hypothetical protein AAFP07_07120 [Cyanobacteria bacterium J06606_4]
MAIYRIFRSAVSSAALLGTALLAVSCGYSSSYTGAEDTRAIAAEEAQADHDHGNHAEAGHDHSSHAADQPKRVNTNHDIFHSKTLEVPAGTLVPAISVRVEQDDVRGWNLYVGTANFSFEPSKVNGESLPTEGHGHLYINDEPIQRIYSTWTHLPTLPGGENEIRVTLNANGHETLTTQDEPIEDSVMIEVYDPNQTDLTDNNTP